MKDEEGGEGERETVRILVTNDDGIRAPGLSALTEAMAPLGQVAVVAPELEQSAVGHGITLMSPLVVEELHGRDEQVRWAVAGSPADCVKLAVLELLDARPDLVASGINLGCNTGINVLYSGTVAAAIEAAFYGITAIAFSLEACPSPNFEAASRVCRQVAETILEQKPASGSLFNVNIPRTDGSAPRGVRVVKQGSIGYGEHYTRRVDPRGRTYYWIGGSDRFEPHDGQTDVRALAESFVTVTPLKFNLTDAEALERLGAWPWRLEGGQS